MSDKIPLLIDTDPGVDDALALLMAFNDPRHDVVGLTIAAGNVGLDHTVRNALKLCEIADVTLPVFAGCAQPFIPPDFDAAYVHGRDGFGDIGYVPAIRTAQAEHAALAILRLSHDYDGELLLVALGPLTNIALALKLDPSLPDRIKRFVVMGGAVTGQGNITVAAEFNIGFDPEAAHIVFAGFPRIELADWEAVLRHGFRHDDFVTWLQGGGPRADFYEAISRKTREWSSDRRGEHWHSADALAMALALEPEGTLALESRALTIELQGERRGATEVDWARQNGRPDGVSILMAYDQTRFEGLIRAALAAG